jgi:hypothetical protein
VFDSPGETAIVTDEAVNPAIVSRLSMYDSSPVSGSQLVKVKMKIADKIV